VLIDALDVVLVSATGKPLDPRYRWAHSARPGAGIV